jgi:hypothetical protein
MRQTLVTFIGILAVFIAAASSAEESEVSGAAETEETCHAMFVQDAKSMSFDGTRLTLKGASRNIIYFCDRPVREAGHMTWDALMELGASGEDSFAKNSPNAAVSVFGSDGEVTQAVVTLASKPSMKGGDAIFPVSMLDGELPEAGGPTVIFIDPIGRPLSPTSVAGVHRRHRRRAIRRHN